MKGGQPIRQPVIIGVADYKNKSKELPEDGSDEPLALILGAIQLAFQDTGLEESRIKDLCSKVDSISVVKPWSWPYPDLATLLAKKLEVKSSSYLHVSPNGGNQPAKLLDEACRRISQGRSEVAIVTGGEALDSLKRYIKAGKAPPPGWTEVDFTSFTTEGLRPPSEANLKGVHGIGAPIQVYPLYENGLRAHEGVSFRKSNDESARMYAEFSKVSEKHPASWNYGTADSEETIGTVTERNRMICLPYPLLMNAFNDINIAGACVVTSSEQAQKLGIPRSKWIHVLGGAGTAESEDFYLRPNYYSSAAISQSIDTALAVSGVVKDRVDLFDFYSCFPIVPKLACRHLDLPTSSPPQPITLLGGLTSFGGAGNNYSMHAIAEMVRQLRAGKGKSGLVLANGGILSYQHVVILSSSEGNLPYPDSPPLPEHCDELPASLFDADAEGEAVIETYTVDFARDGRPKRGHVIGRLLKNHHRFIANHGDDNTLQQLSTMNGEPIGRRGWVRQNSEKPGQNLFTLAPVHKL